MSRSCSGCAVGGYLRSTRIADAPSQMKQDVEDGCAREAQAQARLLAEEAGCVAREHRVPLRVRLSCSLRRRTHSAKQKESFVAMVSHEVSS